MTTETPTTAASTTGHAAAKAGSGPDVAFATLTNGADHAMLNWLSMSSGATSEMAELTQEFFAFANARMQADLEAWKAMTACQTPAELLECQQRFSEAAIKQYADEMSKLGSRLIGLMARPASPVRQPPARRYKAR